MLEIETKILNSDMKLLRDSLKENKATFIGNYFFRRWVYDISPGNEDVRFVRIRTDGITSTLTYKFRDGPGLSNTEEIETSVSDFDKAAEIFSKLLSRKFYQESKRELYKLGGAQISIDQWPMIKPYIEIEAKSEGAVRKAIDLLGIKGIELGNVGVVAVYKFYGLNLHKYKILKF